MLIFDRGGGEHKGYLWVGLRATGLSKGCGGKIDPESVFVVHRCLMGRVVLSSLPPRGR